MTQLPRKPHVAFDVKRKRQFLELYKKTGLSIQSAIAVGISRHTLFEHRSTDQEFAEAYDEAKDLHTEVYIIQPALERASHGIEEAVYGGRFKDEVVGYKRVYSDSLMSRFLSARVAEFRTGADLGESRTGGVLVVPQTSMTYEEWQAKFGTA